MCGAYLVTQISTRRKERREKGKSLLLWTSCLDTEEYGAWSRHATVVELFYKRGKPREENMTLNDPHFGCSRVFNCMREVSWRKNWGGAYLYAEQAR